MAGFVAILNGDGAPVDSGLLRSLLDVPPFGGERHMRTERGVGVACALLHREPHATPELSQSWFVEGSLTIALDGRLDDRTTLRAQLEADSYRDVSDAADAELLAAAYRKWGAECPRHLLGDFAFCIWDGARRSLIAARDHFGVKPLYIVRHGNALMVTNVLRSARRHPSVSDRLDERTAGDFLLFGLGMDSSRTSFADIARVPPAHLVAYTHLETTPRVSHYWALEPPEVLHDRDGSEAFERFAAAMRVAVGDRLRDGPVGIFMSGGLDSSSIAAIAAEALGPSARTQLRAFTGVYNNVAEDEEHYYSSIVAATLNIGIDHVPLDGYAMFETWDRGGLPPEPTSEPLTATTADLLDRAADHGVSVLAGDGGDPLLLPSTFIEQLGDVPLSRLLIGVGRSLRLGKRPPIGIRAMIRRRVLPDATEVPAWLAEPLRRSFDPHGRWLEVQAQRSARHGSRSAAFNRMIDPWWPSTFEGYDPGSTGRPVVMRYPFFDVRLANAALRLPSFPYCVDKHVLRRAMQGRLPDVIRLRPKTPLVVSPESFHGGWSMDDAVRALEAAPGIGQYVDIAKFASMVRPGDLFTTRAPGSLEAVCLATWLRHSARAMALA